MSICARKTAGTYRDLAEVMHIATDLTCTRIAVLRYRQLQLSRRCPEVTVIVMMSAILN